MIRALIAAFSITVLLALSGCGSSNSSPPIFETQILSNQALDGDIELNLSNVAFVTQGNALSVFAGIDPVTGSEFRAFLDFTLNSVPGDAFIDSATLEIFIKNISILPAATSIPIRIELISFSPQTLLAAHYDRNILPPLEFTTIIPPITRNDIGRFVPVDVTPLMVEAQRQGLTHFQIRILEDFGFVSPGLIEIDDATDNRAPLLKVTYF
jgi:hypothetical protein